MTQPLAIVSAMTTSAMTTFSLVSLFSLARVGVALMQYEQTPLFNAADEGHLDVVTTLLSTRGVDGTHVPFHFIDKNSSVFVSKPPPSVP